MLKSFYASAKKGKPAIAMILSAAFWGLGSVLSKGILEYILPLKLVEVQLTASVTLLWIITLSHPGSKRELLPELFDHRQAWKLLFLGLPGLLEPGFGYMFCMLELARTSASNATLIGGIEPAIVISIAWIFLGESVGFYLLWLSTLNIIGAVLTVGFDSNLNASSLIGDLLVVAGTVCAAVYAVLSRRGVQQLSALPLTAIQQSFGWILVLVICWLASGESTLFNFAGSQAILGLAIASGIIQYAVPYWLYLVGPKTISASIAAQFLTLIPVFGTVGGYVFLGERLTLMQGFGMALTLTAVFLIARLRKDE